MVPHEREALAAQRDHAPDRLAFARLMLRPATRICPEVGRSAPNSRRRSEVLPGSSMNARGRFPSRYSMRTWYVVVSSSGVTRPTAYKHPCFALQRKPLARRDLACSSNERGFRRMLCFRFPVVFLCRLFPKVRVLQDTPSDRHAEARTPPK